MPNPNPKPKISSIDSLCPHIPISPSGLEPGTSTWQFTLRDLFAVTTGVCVLAALAARFTSGREETWLGVAVLIFAVTVVAWLVDRIAYH